MIRRLLYIYRIFQYKACGRHKSGSMSVGVFCHHTPFEEEINHGDVIHPCVRYIPEGYLGHKWWMVYTPYYQSNDKTENPIMCYAESNAPEPPTQWIAAYQVQGQPAEGYNSDPVLFYDEGKLYVMWRENDTPRCKTENLARATFGALVGEQSIGEVFGPLVGTNDPEMDAETSPTFVKDKDGKYYCLAMHLRFHSKKLKILPRSIKGIVSKVALVFDLMGIWSQQKHYGIAIWSSNILKEEFQYEETIKFYNKNALYRPWHMDFFYWEGKLYGIVQTNMSNADIVLAESKDGRHFKLHNTPLMTNETCGKVGIYKPTGGVVNGKFYLYYTAQDKDNRALNKLYLTTCPFNDLIGG